MGVILNHLLRLHSFFGTRPVGDSLDKRLEKLKDMIIFRAEKRKEENRDETKKREKEEPSERNDKAKLYQNGGTRVPGPFRDFLESHEGMVPDGLEICLGLPE